SARRGVGLSGHPGRGQTRGNARHRGRQVTPRKYRNVVRKRIKLGIANSRYLQSATNGGEVVQKSLRPPLVVALMQAGDTADHPAIDEQGLHHTPSFVWRASRAILAARSII